MVAAVLAESAPLALPEASEGKGIWRSRLIEADVEGSSGFYSAKVLKRDGPTAFPSGTHVYYDHPTPTEETDRPERSVRDLAGYLVDDARFEEGSDGRGLFANIQFVGEAKELAQSFAPVIGLSIRASGDIENTSKGRVVRSIGEGMSVDLVTRAGAGGRLVNMTESSKSDATPAENEQPVPPSGDIPSTTGSGTLVNEVASLKESISDRIEQFDVTVARLSQQLQETRRDMDKQLRDNAKMTEAIAFLRDRAETAEQKMQESKSLGDRLAEIIKSGLPVSSMVRIAQTHQVDQDLHESITQEREYLKKVLRESERGSLNQRTESSSELGLTESAMNAALNSPSTSASVSDEDVSKMDAFLSGKLY